MYIYCIWISPTFSMKGECSAIYMYTHSTYILTCVYIYSYMYVYACMFIGIYMYVNTHVSEYFSLAFFVPVKSLILKVTLEITFPIMASLAICLNFYHLHSTHHWLFHSLFISLFFFLTLTTDYFAIYFTCFLLFFIVFPCRAMLLEGRDVLFCLIL